MKTKWYKSFFSREACHIQNSLIYYMSDIYCWQVWLWCNTAHIVWQKIMTCWIRWDSFIMMLYSLYCHEGQWGEETCLEWCLFTPRYRGYPVTRALSAMLSMAGRALLAGYPRYYYDCQKANELHLITGSLASGRLKIECAECAALKPKFRNFLKVA